MSWGIELWDQFENLSIYSQKNIDFCEKLAQFIKERCSIESDYAARLKKLTKNFKLKKKEDENEFTTLRGFSGMVNEVHDMAGQHEVIVEGLTNVVLKNIQLLLQQLKQDRKKFVQDGSKQMSSMQSQLSQLDKVKKQYEKSFKEAEKAQDTYKKADADVHMSRADVEKARNIMVQKEQACDECKNEYAAELQKTNQAQQQHYQILMPEVFRCLQESEENRVIKTAELIKNCADTEKSILPIINTCIDGMNKASSIVNAQEDCKAVIEKYKSGFEPPGDIVFEDLSAPVGSGGTNGSVNHGPGSVERSQTLSSRPSLRSESLRGSLAGMGRGRKRSKILGLFSGSKGDDNKEDFSHLPPNQQKKKLNQRIDSIKATLAKDTAERDGMLKMQDVYKQNQALGDPESLSKQLEENAQKLDKQRQLLHKYEAYLSDVESSRSTSSALDSSWSSGRGNSSIVSNTSQGSLPVTPETNRHQNRTSVLRAASDVSVNHRPVIDQQRISTMTQDTETFDDIDDDDLPLPSIGTCQALYAFDAPSEGSITMRVSEQFSLLELDQGDGWTRVRRDNGEEGPPEKGLLIKSRNALELNAKIYQQLTECESNEAM